VRSYNGEGLDQATARRITDYVATLNAPFDAGCRVELVRSAFGGGPVKLGTYGSIRGAVDWLALVVRGDEPWARTGGAYVFEQTILWCTSLGLGTCWLVGFFDRGGFKKGLSLRPGERLVAVSPVGRAADKPHLSLTTLYLGNKPTPRKPFGEMFFDDSWDRPLTEAAAGRWALPLEMVRRAPSANNKQTWRVILADGANGEGSGEGSGEGANGGDEANATPESGPLHFYKASTRGYENFDAGIALCHFAETCRHAGLAGRFERLTDAPSVPAPAAYVASWV
jgi:nitroreductase